MYYFIYIVKNNNMNKEQYQKIIKRNIKVESPIKNILIAFFSGGVVGLISELLTNYLIGWFNLSISDAYLMTFIIFITIGSILTGFGIFDKVLSTLKCGLIVPATGFANTMTSSAMDTRSEGFIKGIGSNIFKLTGSIILYGVIFGIIFGYIRSVIL